MFLGMLLLLKSCGREEEQSGASKPIRGRDALLYVWIAYMHVKVSTLR
jgi:hypothetical protein